MNNLEKNLSVLAPVSGKIIALEQVPDPVFSGKTLGDGVAITYILGQKRNVRHFTGSNL